MVWWWRKREKRVVLLEVQEIWPEITQVARERGSSPISSSFFPERVILFFFFPISGFSSPEFLFFGLSLYVFPFSGFLSGLLACSFFSREFFLM